MELALDTSTEIASLALSRQGEVVVELSWRTGQSHSVDLFPSILHLLEQASSNLSSLTSIIVAKGPGSFTGIRVGMTVAKGLAFALSLPLVAVSTLEVEALPLAETGLPICPVHSVGGGELAVALFQKRRGKWQRLWEEQLVTPEDLARRILRKTVFCGELTPPLERELKEKLGPRAILASSATRLRRAGYLAALGQLKLERGERDSLETLQPLYLRRPHITLKNSGGKDG